MKSCIFDENITITKKVLTMMTIKLFEGEGGGAV